MKKNSFIFVQVLFVYSCSFFAVPCSASHAVINHSEDMSTTVYSDDGTNQNLEDAIKQSLEAIFQVCKDCGSESLMSYTSNELMQLWSDVLNIDGVVQEHVKYGFKKKEGYERFDDIFWDIDCWTGKKKCYPYNYIIKEIFDVTDEIGYVNVLCQCQDVYDEPLDDVVVTVKMKYEKKWEFDEEKQWVVDNVFNLKNMLREYIKSGKKIPVDLRYKDIEDVSKPVGKSNNDPCDRIFDAYEQSTDLRKAALASNDREEKVKLFLKAYNILKEIMADPNYSDCFIMEDSAKGNLEFIEEELKELGVEL